MFDQHAMVQWKSGGKQHLSVRGTPAHLWNAMSAKVLLNGCGDGLAHMPGAAGTLKHSLHPNTVSRKAWSKAQKGHCD